MSLLSPIRVRVRLFAMQRQIAGTRELLVELPMGATVEDAWAAAADAVPALAPGRPTLRFAVNGDYADPSASLAHDDEVAVIPPVSGGAGEADEQVRVLEIRSEPFPAGLASDLAAQLATVWDGAVVTFAGQTRVTPGTPAPGQEAEAARHVGSRVEGLDYEAFAPMALAVFVQIADEIESRFGVRRVAIVHRIGAVPPGDTSVLVVAAAPHRDAAFDAARYAIDELKARAPIWKAERFDDGRVWMGEPARTSASPAVDPASA